jgi:hypothetical protein
VRSIVRSTKPGTPARAIAIADAAAKIALLGGAGRHGKISEQTLGRWIARYETGGEVALLGTDGTARSAHIRLSRHWDAVMMDAGASEIVIFAIAEAVRACIRAAWMVTGGGWRQVQITVLPAVAALTRSAGVPLGDDLLASPCMLSRESIERDSPARRPPGAAAARRILSND